MPMGGVEITALTTLVGLFVWYLKYTTKQNVTREEKHDAIQKEERLFNRNIITNELGKINQGYLKNTELNNQSIGLIKDMNKNLEDHNGHSQKAWEKTVDILTLMCNKLNGGDPNMVKAKKRLNKDRRKKDKPVEVDRRV